MSDISLGPQQDRSITGGRVLQRRAHFARVERINPTVSVEHGEEGGGVVDTVTHVVQRGVRQQPFELLGILRGAVLDIPRGSQPELLVTHHVEQGRAADHGVHQIGSLRHHCSHEQSTVRATADRQCRWSAPSVGDEVLASGDEIVVHVLLLPEHSIAVPLLTFLRASPQVGDDIHTTGFHPGQHRGRVPRGQRHAETAVSVENRGPRLVGRVSGTQDHHANGGAVAGDVLDLLRVDGRHVDTAWGISPSADFAGGAVESEDA